MNANEARGLQQPPWLPRNFQDEASGGCALGTSLEHGHGAQAQALGGRKGLVALPPQLHPAWGSRLEPCLTLGWNWGLHPSLSKPGSLIQRICYSHQAVFLVLDGLAMNGRAVDTQVSAGVVWDGMQPTEHKPSSKPCSKPHCKAWGGTGEPQQRSSVRKLQLYHADISRFLILHPTLHWICLAWPRFVEEFRLGFIEESPGEIPRREFFRKQWCFLE